MKPIFTKSSPSGLQVFFLLALAVALMILDKRVAAVNQLRAVLSIPFAPLQYAVSWPIELFDKLHDTVVTHDRLVTENLELKAEQLRLRAQVQRLLAIELENNQLKSLVRSSADIPGKVSIAQLLAVATDPFFKQVIINKGSRDHVFVGQPVLDASGVMGQVIQVGLAVSRVLLINDIHSGIPIQIVRNGVRAVVTGDALSGKLRLLNIPQTTDVRVGDVLMTSGLGEHFPEGYPVGQVAAVTRDPGLQFMNIMVEPAARLDRSRGVLLVWPYHQVQT
jgi:rod shape-determining protein MreC